MIADTQRLETLKQKKKSLEAMLERLKGSTQPEDMEKLRKEWIEPVEKEIEELEKK